ncbi:inositol polyphosphate 5-phosphatase [Acrasis kona]|uniref:Inositol polyphosphate 5-phosphatase n=1 Tax=Acrasis kona TaxID=1008807 RepID=A0AAW2YWU3_9EUKA
MKRIKQQVETYLNTTEECKLLAELILQKETKAKVLLCLVANRRSPHEMALILFEKAKEEYDTAIRIMSFRLLKKDDFGLKIVSELQFDLFFKENTALFSFESTSVSTMWSVINALTNAVKVVNTHVAPNQEDTDFDFDTYTWAEFYTKYTEPDQNLEKETSKAEQRMMISDNDKKQDQTSDFRTSVAIKEDWIAKQLQNKEDQFTEKRPLTFVIGTWNVNSKIPNHLVSSWLRINEDEAADVYAVGLQEIDMTAGALLTQETKISDQWTKIITDTVNSCTSHKYVCLLSKQLVGIYLIVFIKEEHLEHVQDLKSHIEGVGIMGMLGNKGAITCQFKLYSSTVCLVTSHLAAHTGGTSKRNQNFADLSQRCHIDDDESIDFIFWFGDLNYRLTLSDADTRQAICDNQISHLLAHDQLVIEKKNNRVFVGYEEGTITFMPSYKFDAGTNIYDTSEKKRTPSYTDRILWKDVHKVGGIQQLYYSMHNTFMISDHKPIVSCFKVPIKIIVQDKYKQLYRELIKMLDKLENDMLPEIQLSTQMLQFDTVEYNSPKVCEMTLENTGQVVCEFIFVPKPGEDYPHKPWIKIEPIGGIIMPHESMVIKVTLKVDSHMAHQLMDQPDLDDILILHLKQGRDHFITVTGKYQVSVYGIALDQQVPECLWRLVDWLYRYGIKEADLFQEAGITEQVHQIRRQLDHHLPFDDNVSVHSVAEAFVGFLESLYDPLIPHRYYRMSIETSSNAGACVHLITKLPKAHFDTFHYVMAFLREVLKHSNENHSSIDTLAIIFSRVILRPPLNYPQLQANSNDLRAKALFVKHFMTQSHHWTREELVQE